VRNTAVRSLSFGCLFQFGEDVLIFEVFVVVLDEVSNDLRACVQRLTRNFARWLAGDGSLLDISARRVLSTPCSRIKFLGWGDRHVLSQGCARPARIGFGPRAAARREGDPHRLWISKTPRKMTAGAWSGGVLLCHGSTFSATVPLLDRELARARRSRAGRVDEPDVLFPPGWRLRQPSPVRTQFRGSSSRRNKLSSVIPGSCIGL